MKNGFWTRDWFIGLLALVVVLVAATGTTLIDSLDRTVYDWGVRNSSATPNQNIAIIAIDEASIASIGRWPCPRSKHAELIDLLAAGDARLIGYSVLFLEEQVDAGLESIRNILDYYIDSGLAAAASKIADQGARRRVENSLSELESMLFDAETALNTDDVLAASIANAGNVVLPMLFRINTPLGNPDQPLPDYITGHKVDNVADGTGGTAGHNVFPPPADIAYIPIPALGAGAAGIGHLTANPDVDGSIRFDPLFINYYQSLYPSLALTVAAKSLNLDNTDIQAKLGTGVSVGNLSITTDPELQMNTFFLHGSKQSTAISN